MKRNQLFAVFCTLIIVSMVLAACAKATPVATEAPVVEATEAAAPVAAGEPLKINLFPCG